MGEFGNLAVVVTCGSSASGPTTAPLLACFGAGVACLPPDRQDLPGPLLGPVADMPDDVAVRAGVVSAAGALGGFDMLVNSAGMGRAGTVADPTDPNRHRVLDLSVVGMVPASGAVLPYLHKSRHGAIVNTCSIAAYAGLPNRALHSASKGAVQALTLAMAADDLAEGIRVNCINPGTVDTPWVRGLLAAADDPNAELRVLCTPAHRPAGEHAGCRCGDCLPCQLNRQFHYRDRARRRRRNARPSAASTRIAVLRQPGRRSRLKRRLVP
jgi:NAD(P)-dependent dehydrogenase (short-subunit alcohol dehydrogenase family)